MVTGIIPAAGLGSRLGAGLPKALVQLEGRSLISFVLASLSPVVDDLVIVVSPGNEGLFEHELEICGWRLPYRLVTQEVPSGSADAVAVGLGALAQDQACIVVWADQVGASRETLRRVAAVLADTPDGAVLPLVSVRSPYVWFEQVGERWRVGRQRDGDVPPEVGTSDLGVFGLRAGAALRAIDAIGEQDETRERDFVYAIPELAGAAPLHVFLVDDADQARGVNTPQDLEAARVALGGVAS